MKLPVLWIGLATSVAGLALLLGGASREAHAAFTTEKWVEELCALDRDGNGRDSFALAHRIADLPAGEGYAIIAEAWPRLSSQTLRCQILKAFYYTLPFPLHARFHPHLFEVLALGIADEDPKVRTWAFSYLKKAAFREFDENEDAEAALEFCASNRSRPVEDVIRESIASWSRRASGKTGASLAAELEIFRRNWSVFRDVPAAREAALEAGLPARLGGWAEARDEEVAGRALRALGNLRLGEEDLRRIVIPVLTSNRSSGVRAAALTALEGKENRWALAPLLEAVRRCVFEKPIDRIVLWAASTSIGRIGDPVAIPELIAAIAADNTYDTVYGVGYFGLGKLTGVDYDESHDGTWWRLWWEENRTRFPEARDLEVPAWTPPRSTPPGGGEAALPDAEDVAHLPARERRVNGDEKKRYLLIGPKDRVEAPEGGYSLVVVLPGGDGGVDFHCFVKRIYEHCLTDRYLVAQLVAPRWSENQLDHVVWPTATHPWKPMRFSTEEFVADVVADVARDLPLDEKKIFALAWSSGGPAAYAVSLSGASPVTGSLIAMSVFKPDQLPPLDRAGDHAYFLLHSPEDFIPIAMARKAREKLSEHGARVKLVEYAGGHGFRGKSYADLKQGFEWLEENAR